MKSGFFEIEPLAVVSNFVDFEVLSVVLENLVVKVFGIERIVFN